MAQGDKKKKSNSGGQAAHKATSEKAEKAEGVRKAADDKVEAAKKVTGDKGASAKESAEVAAEDKPKKKAAAPEEKAVSAKAARSEEHDEPHHGEAKSHGAHVAHGHKPNRREYLVIFVVLFVLTVLEVIVAQIPGIGKTTLGVLLVGMAVAKAAIVGLFYMHLKQETRILRTAIAIPLAAPALYAFVLIAEAAWRLR